MDEPSELMTAAQVSALIQRSREALRKDRVHGVGVPYVRIGSSIRYQRSDVLAFIESHRVETTGVTP